MSAPPVGGITNGVVGFLDVAALVTAQMFAVESA